MSKRILTTPLDKDPGGEGGRGYDYQWHIGARMAIDMLCNKETEYIVCEFHEDIININRGMGLKLVQIKKRETQNWTMHSLVAPEKKQKQGILCKLFAQLANGKDVKSLLLTGFGRVGNEGEVSLSHFITLLKYPLGFRDASWDTEMSIYIDHFCDKLVPQGIERDTILQAVTILDIDFTLPHPDGIEHQNCLLLNDFLQNQFQVELTMPEVMDIYDNLYKRVRQVSTNPGQPWSVKSISRQAATDIVYAKLKMYKPLGNRQQILTAHEKLASVGMSDKYHYAIERRLDAMRLRFELDISSSQWETFRSEIDYHWRSYREAYPTVNGPALWMSLRTVLLNVSESWARTHSRLDASFAEGVFFDMTGTCEVRWSTQA